MIKIESNSFKDIILFDTSIIVHKPVKFIDVKFKVVEVGTIKCLNSKG